VTGLRGAELSSGEIEECFNLFWSRYRSAFAESARLNLVSKAMNPVNWQCRPARPSDYEKQF
jgi:hypothetical protein